MTIGIKSRISQNQSKTSPLLFSWPYFFISAHTRITSIHRSTSKIHASTYVTLNNIWGYISKKLLFHLEFVDIIVFNWPQTHCSTWNNKRAADYCAPDSWFSSRTSNNNTQYHHWAYDQLFSHWPSNESILLESGLRVVSTFSWTIKIIAKLLTS